jgi:N-acetylglucosaminyldiphosphoundecaprenol N-acetyl-beta-D-mannosaminyltransferase
MTARPGRSRRLILSTAMEAHDFAVPDKNARLNDLERNIYCIFGLAIDALDMPSILRRIDAAAAGRSPFLISTPNLNFIVQSRSNTEFRESILDSDLCPADGITIVWIARLIGVPIKQRVSGSDIFQALKAPDRVGQRLKVFLFGGAPGVAETAARTLNALPSGLSCVGTFDPGVGSVDEMSCDHIIDKINASQADFLAASLGAKKGQLWLRRNHFRITVPLRAHLGATINFEAGTIKRAPAWLRTGGLEWLWRIKEEPHLWRRYAYDGLGLIRLMFTHLVPLAALGRWHRVKSNWQSGNLLITRQQRHDSVTVAFAGDANERNINTAIACLRETLTRESRDVVIDLADTRVIDGRFFGLLLMVRKHLKGQGAKLGFVGVSPAMWRLFWLNGVDFLLKDPIEKS